MNPVLQMSRARQQAYLDHADPEDFFDTLTLLVALYAKKLYDPKKHPQSASLLEDYEEHRKAEARAW